MPGVTLPPNQSHTLGTHIARTERIERQTQPKDLRQPFEHTLLFTYPGALAGLTPSPPWYPTTNIILTGIRISLLLPASADHTLNLVVGVATHGPYTLPSGDSTIYIPLGLPMDASDPLVVVTGTVSDANLSVQFTIAPR